MTADKNRIDINPRKHRIAIVSPLISSVLILSKIHQTRYITHIQFSLHSDRPKSFVTIVYADLFDRGLYANSTSKGVRMRPRCLRRYQYLHPTMYTRRIIRHVRDVRRTQVMTEYKITLSGSQEVKITWTSGMHD